jgi:hypothetical protein
MLTKRHSIQNSGANVLPNHLTDLQEILRSNDYRRACVALVVVDVTLLQAAKDVRFFRRREQT